MLTIIAWLVFVPAAGWNIIIFSVAFEALMSPNSEIEWTSKRNLRDLTISLIILFVPGVYLFGWF